jgi:phosphoribosylglycinamide formyltransferase 1
MKMRIAVAISGRGSNLVALLDALGPGARAQVALVLSDRAEAAGLDRARDRDIPAETLSHPADGDEWLRLLWRFRIDLVVLAG